MQWHICCKEIKRKRRGEEVDLKNMEEKYISKSYLMNPI